jgi:hypothetical protein
MKEQRRTGIQIRKPGVRIRGSESVNVTDPEHCIKLLDTALAHSCQKCSSSKRCMKAVLDLLKLRIICKYRMYLFGVKLLYSRRNLQKEHWEH